MHDLLSPWRPKGKIINPERCREFWTRELEHLTVARSKLYRQALRNRSEDRWKEFHTLDRQIKQKAAAAKRQCYSKFTAEMAGTAHAEASRRLGRILAVRRGNARRNLRTQAPIEPSCFTEYIRRTSGTRPIKESGSQKPFEVRRELRKDIAFAVAKAPLGKAAGPDEIFAEIFRIDEELSTQLIWTMWKKCGELGWTPRQWRETKLVPIFKKGDMRDPANYRPIASLSHMRKIVEKALDLMLRRNYRFSVVQTGFRPKQGVENALLRYQRAIRTGHRSVGVLDMKAAYDRVPREKLLETLATRLPKVLVEMISVTLAPCEASTVGDTDGHAALLTRGVPQSSPLSPALFNIYMDTLAERLCRVPPTISEWPVNFFADDVELVARSMGGLQKLLQICENWAEDHGMEWAANKCAVICKRPSSGPSLQLACKKLQELIKCRYLGVTISAQGIEQDMTRQRLQAARGRLNELRKVGFGRTAFGISLGLRLYKTFVRPMYEFAIYLTPLSRKDEGLISGFESQAIGLLVKGFKRGFMPRLRKILGLQGVRARRAHLREKLRKRLTSKVEDTSTTVTAEEKWVATLDQAERNRDREGEKSSNTLEELSQVWRANEIAYKNKIPVQKGCGAIPAMYLKQKSHQAMATHWYLGWFPKRPDVESPNFGSCGKWALTKLKRRLSQRTWKKEEEKEVERLFEILSAELHDL